MKARVERLRREKQVALMTRKVLPAKDLGLAVDHLKMLDAMCKTFDARMRHGSRSASIKTFNLFLDFSLARDRVKRLEGQ